MATNSRFTSGGTNDEPTQRDAEWLEAEQDIEKRRQEKLQMGQQEGGKSLFETLQMNKAAKQEKFEESMRLTNQFRNLDQDEVDFLDSVTETTRAKEAAAKKETAEQLEAFRKQQEDAEKAVKGTDSVDSSNTLQTSWATGARKRKKARDGEIAGVKIRRTSTQATEGRTEPASAAASPSASPSRSKAVAKVEALSDDQVKTAGTNGTRQLAAPNGKPTSLGLAAYSSDEDE